MRKNAVHSSLRSSRCTSVLVSAKTASDFRAVKNNARLSHRLLASFPRFLKNTMFPKDKIVKRVFFAVFRGFFYFGAFVLWAFVCRYCLFPVLEEFSLAYDLAGDWSLYANDIVCIFIFLTGAVRILEGITDLKGDVCPHCGHVQ